LNIQNQVIIDDYTYIQLFGRNIWNELMDKLNNNCSKCNTLSDRLHETKMNTNYCKECLLDLINKYTENYVVLNEYEKSNIIFLEKLSFL